MDSNILTSSKIIDIDDVVLLIIDIQEKLIPVINEKEEVIKNTLKLLKFAKIIRVPVIYTEQKNLGLTISDIKKEIKDVNPIEKIEFNCFLCKEFVSYFQQIGRKSLIIAGIEAHICVAQTALHALSNFSVHVVNDAISSRLLDNKKIAIERMRQSGVIITSTEMVMFELLKRAGTDEFRAVRKLII